MNDKTNATSNPYLSGIMTRFQNFEKLPNKTYFLENEFMKTNEIPTYNQVLPHSISQGQKQVPFEIKTSIYGNDVPNADFTQVKNNTSTTNTLSEGKQILMDVFKKLIK